MIKKDVLRERRHHKIIIDLQINLETTSFSKLASDKYIAQIKISLWYAVFDVFPLYIYIYIWIRRVKISARNWQLLRALECLRYLNLYIYIYYNSVCCLYLTSWVCGKPNVIYLGECWISVIELLYNNNNYFSFIKRHEIWSHRQASILLNTYKNKYIFTYIYIYIYIYVCVCVCVCVCVRHIRWKLTGHLKNWADNVNVKNIRKKSFNHAWLRYTTDLGFDPGLKHLVGIATLWICNTATQCVYRWQYIYIYIIIHIYIYIYI